MADEVVGCEAGASDVVGVVVVVVVRRPVVVVSRGSHLLSPAPRPLKLEAVSRSLSAPLGGGMSARCSGQVVASARFGGCGYLYGSIM